jgi:vacuolar iron transporter family protein
MSCRFTSSTGSAATYAARMAPDPIDLELAPAREHHHRDIQGGTARAAVFGVSDGLVSNVALILGVAGADSAQGPVRLAGLAGLLAGAVSMAAGEWVSMQAQKELFERELAVERRELERNPNVEAVELAQTLMGRGLGAEHARAMAREVSHDVDLALEVHAREELGFAPGSLGAPIGAAASSFVAFAAGAALPLLPWLFGGGSGALVASVVLALFGAVCVGLALARFTGRSPWRSALRQTAIASVAAAITFLVGRAVGVGV